MTRVRKLRHLAGRVSAALVARLAVAAIYLLATLLRADSGIRRVQRLRPRVLWGPTPLINMKYWSGSIRLLGYRSRTFANVVYPAFERTDFDVVRDRILPSRRFDSIRDYLVFAWTLLKADVFVTFFDGGYLATTPLRDRELRLVHLAGKRVVVVPFGSDTGVSGHLGPLQEGYEVHYPDVLARADQIRERVLWFSEQADLIIQPLQVGFQPRYDVFWTNTLAIDTEHWHDQRPHTDHDGRNGEVVIVHAPNHRDLKGTDKLIEAVERLRAEGLQVRLDILEGRANEDVREAVLSADIVGDQFVVGFGLFAVEAMSAGRPVVTALGWVPAEWRDAVERQSAPVVDADERPLADTLRDLVEHPELRREIGAASRAHALERHSYAAVGRVWSMIVDHVWLGSPLGPPLIQATAQRQPEFGGTRVS